MHRSLSSTAAARLGGIALIAAALFHPRPAAAQAGAESWFTWETCTNPVGNVMSTGQSAVRQVISMQGLSGRPGDFTMLVTMGRGGGERSAWGCALGAMPYPAPLAGIVPATASSCADVVPGLTVTGAPIPCVTPDCMGGWLIQGTFPPGTNLDPSRRYALVDLDYDLTRVTPALCPYASVGTEQCFGLTYNSLASGPYFAQPAWLLSWNRADGNTGVCAGVVPARTSTWGQIKSRYR